MRRKIIGTIAFAIAIVVSSTGATGSACSDPGDPNGGGKVKYVPLFVQNGTVLTKRNAGLYHASTEGPYASTERCRWTVTIKGKIAASGGVHDAIIAAPGIWGGVVHMNRYCKRFAK